MEKCGQGCHNCIKRIRRKALEEFVWKRGTFFTAFWLWAKEFRSFGENDSNFRSIVAVTAHYVSRGSFWGEQFLQKNIFFKFFFSSESGQKTFGLMLHLFGRVFKCFLHLRTDILTEKGFFERKRTFSVPFRTLNKKLLAFWRKLFGRVVKCILRVQKNILTKIASVKNEGFRFVFGKSAKIFRAVGGKKAGLSKQQSLRPKNILRKTVWMRNLSFLLSFPHLQRHSFRFFVKENESVVMTTLCVQLIFSRKIMFFENNVFFRNKFGLWAKILDFSWQTHGMVARTAFYAP